MNLQIVDVAVDYEDGRRFAYGWNGPQPLAIGDRVLLPENEYSRTNRGPGSFTGTVVRLGTDYRGTVRLIIGKVNLDQ